MFAHNLIIKTTHKFLPSQPWGHLLTYWSSLGRHVAGIDRNGLDNAKHSNFCGSFCNGRSYKTQQSRSEGTRMWLYKWIVYSRLTYFVVQTFYSKTNTARNTSKIHFWVSRCVRLHLLKVRNENCSVLFIVTWVDQFVCHMSQEAATFKPEHSTGAHKVK